MSDWKVGEREREMDAVKRERETERDSKHAREGPALTCFPLKAVHGDLPHLLLHVLEI